MSDLEEEQVQWAFWILRCVNLYSHVEYQLVGFIHQCGAFSKFPPNPNDETIFVCDGCGFQIRDPYKEECHPLYAKAMIPADLHEKLKESERCWCGWPMEKHSPGTWQQPPNSQSFVPHINEDKLTAEDKTQPRTPPNYLRRGE